MAGKEYINPNTYVVHLSGPAGEEITMAPRQKMVLSEYYDKYRVRGFIRLTGDKKSEVIQTTRIRNKLSLNKTRHNMEQIQTAGISRDKQQLEQKRQQRQAISKTRQTISKAKKIVKKTPTNAQTRQIVGRRLVGNADELLYRNLEINPYPISNNIGVGIMAFNRIGPLCRLIESIMRNTDLTQTTVFVSDDYSTNPEMHEYLTKIESNPNIVVLRNNERGGIACNSNRLIRCLSRFKYSLILNDDVEILRPGWDTFYADIMDRTGIHHMMYRQYGVYGAKDGQIANINGVNLKVVHDKPHGAVLAFTRDMLVACGYFNEAYGMYGMEHVDWSMKPHEFGMQQSGFWDADGSHEYFRIYDEKSAVEDKTHCLNNAKKLFSNRTPKMRVGPSDKSKVPEITYVIPFRNTGRTDCIEMVISNIRAQRYPVIHIVIVEQDNHTNIDISKLQPVYYYLRHSENPLFNKSLAFNLGVSKAPSEKLILHDADIMAQGHYTANISSVLDTNDGCHLGKTVIYADKESTDRVCNSRCVDKSVKCERMVGYFEGGSLACTKHAYWQIGAFCQDFCGYGCEDCDFYQRLSSAAAWKEDRVFNFFHLWHGRVQHWNAHHAENKDKATLLCSMSMADRVKLQHKRLVEQGWEEALRSHLSG